MASYSKGKRVSFRTNMAQFLCLLGMVYLYITTFMFFLPWLCRDLGFSVYYTQSVNTIERLENVNSERTSKAKEFLASAPMHMAKWDYFNHSQKKDLQFGFIIVSLQRRQDPHYLIQVVARLMAQTLQENVRTETVVLNVDKTPDLNEDARVVSNYVTVLDQHTLYQKIKINTSYDSIYDKEKHDYAFALEIGIKLGAKYTIIIEDDALPDSQLIQKLQLIVRRKIPGNWLKTHSDWAFLKLYYPEKWQGYGNSEIHELICIFLLGGILPLRIFKGQNWQIIVFLFFAFGLYSTALAYGVGRAHWIELRRLSPWFYTVSNAPGCCTPAVLYADMHIKEVVDFLMSKKCSTNYPLDIALDEFADTLKLQKYLVTPNLFTHIGFHSSLGKANKDLREFSLLLDP